MSYDFLALCALHRNAGIIVIIFPQVTLINFMITLMGLEDQLLGIVAAKEKPELEEKKNKLILESAKNKKEVRVLLEFKKSKSCSVFYNESHFYNDWRKCPIQKIPFAFYEILTSSFAVCNISKWEVSKKASN